MCGIFGVFNAPDAAEMCAAGLHGIQHRARDYAGMVTTDGTRLRQASGKGLARQVFVENTIKVLRGSHALGHIRYSTKDDGVYGAEYGRAQPILQSGVALAHNGNLRNDEELRRELGAQKPFATTMDSECILRLFLQKEGSVQEKMKHVFSRIHGSASLGILTRDTLIAARDPSGNRPLYVGKEGDTFFISSESVSLDQLGVQEVRGLGPGEVLSIRAQGVHSRTISLQVPYKPCVFEEIYYAHPASEMFGGYVVSFRERLGAMLADAVRKKKDTFDVVVPVPDSANYIATGVAQALGVRYYPALTRSHYIGRTFIADNKQDPRSELVRRKFLVIKERVAGRRVLLIDDSIVRLTTLPIVVRMLREAGAREVHVGIACPPIKHPCVYGIDTPDYDELEAAHSSTREIKEKVQADSLTYLSLETLKEVSSPNRCFACMDGKYW